MPSLGLEAVRHLKNRLESRASVRFRRIVTTCKPVVTMRLAQNQTTALGLPLTTSLRCWARSRTGSSFAARGSRLQWYNLVRCILRLVAWMRWGYFWGYSQKRKAADQAMTRASGQVVSPSVAPEAQYEWLIQIKLELS